MGFVVAAAAWGLAIAPFNGFHDHHARSVAIGVVLLMAGGLGFGYRERLYDLLRARHGWLLLVAAVGIAALWIDGGWRSSYYLASYAAILLAAVTAGVRWSLLCGTCLLVGYVAGLMLHGYTWAELEALRDADSVVANAGGYLLAAGFFALPVSWLGSYVARIHQVLTEPFTVPVTSSQEPRQQRTASLTVREVEVAQLVAAGMTNDEIAHKLVLSSRTIQSHVQAALKKAKAKNRAELAALAVREGLVPSDRHRMGKDPPSEG